MKPTVAQELCTSCGLCCDGSLFADVELGGQDDPATLEALGLEVEEADEPGQTGLLIQPCAALQGKRCRIYAHRPECCRTFACRLLQDVQRGALDLPTARAQIADVLARIPQVRTLIADLGATDSTLTLRENVDAAMSVSARQRQPGRPQIQKQLRTAMAALEQRIHAHFLRE